MFADELGMTDDQLDEFVEAGWGIEIHGGERVVRGRTKAQADTDLDSLDAEETYDELLAKARVLDIHGRSYMKRDELAAAIAKHPAAQ